MKIFVSLIVGVMQVFYNKQQRSAPSVYKQENCRRYQSSRGQTTINKSTMSCLQIQL